MVQSNSIALTEASLIYLLQQSEAITEAILSKLQGLDTFEEHTLDSIDEWDLITENRNFWTHSTKPITNNKVHTTEQDYGCFERLFNWK